MSNQYLNTQIIFPDNNSIVNIDEEKKGVVILTPKIDLKFINFGLELMLVARGRTSVQKRYFQHQILAKNQILKQGDTYKYEFKINGISPGTYQGRNISFNWEIQTFFELESETSKILRNSFLKNFQLLKAFNPNDKLAYSQELTFHFSTDKYFIENSKSELEPTENHPLLYLAVLIICPSILLYFFGTTTSYWLSFLFILALSTYLLFIYYKHLKIGKVKTEINTLENNQFALKLFIEKSTKNISQIDIQYKIKEEIIDDRGTSSSTYNESIFTSEKLTSRNPSKTSEFIFKFPDKNINALPTFNLENIKFYWEVEVTAHFDFGGTLRFIQEIKVEKSE